MINNLNPKLISFKYNNKKLEFEDFFQEFKTEIRKFNDIDADGNGYLTK